VRDLVVGSGIEFADRGTHELKDVPGARRVPRVARLLSRALSRRAQPQETHTCRPHCVTSDMTMAVVTREMRGGQVPHWLNKDAAFGPTQVWPAGH
jgi:hypothetical protein